MLDGQRVHRTRLALAEIRGRLPEGVCRRPAKASIGEYFVFYDERRLHQALGYRTPMADWREGAAPTAYGHVDNASALTKCPQADQKSAADRTFGGLIKDNRQTASQLNRRQRRSRFAGPLQSWDAERMANFKNWLRMAVHLMGVNGALAHWESRQGQDALLPQRFA